MNNKNKKDAINKKFIEDMQKTNNGELDYDYELENIEDDITQEEIYEISERIPDTMQFIINHLAQHKLLSREEEQELAIKAINGDKNAATKLALCNTKLVISIAKHYVKSVQDLPDAIQNGYIGLMKAVEKFDPSLNYRFSTYASWWIKQSILREKSNTDSTIRIPVHRLEKVQKIKKLKNAFLMNNQREPTLDELVKISGEKPEDIIEFERIITPIVSLDAPVSNDDGDSESTLGDFIPDLNNYDPDNFTLKEEVNTQLHRLLSDKEIYVLTRRFGLDDGERCTLEQIGNTMHVTRERVRQIEAKALRKLRNNYKLKNKLRDYVV